MSYKKGQVLVYDYPVQKHSSVINDYHRVVVLHKRETPYNTVLVAPITTAKGLKLKGKIPSNYVELLQVDYPFALDYDSYINLDMTIAVDEVELNDLERFNKKINTTLNPFDLLQLDYKIALTYELSKYIESNIAEEFENVILYIDENIKVRIENILSKINNPEILNDVISIIDDLMNVLRETYIKK